MSASMSQRTVQRRDFRSGRESVFRISFFGEFDPGSGRTLAARLTHASRTGTNASVFVQVADG